MTHTQPIRSERLIQVGPETLVELIKGISLCLFASGSSGAIGFSTGFAILSPGARLPYHTHPCSESITTIKGQLEVAVEGRTYHLSPFDSIHVPTGTAHTVASLGKNEQTVVLTAFASGEISRTLVADEFARVNREKPTSRARRPGIFDALQGRCPVQAISEDNLQESFRQSTGLRGNLWRIRAARAWLFFALPYCSL